MDQILTPVKESTKSVVGQSPSQCGLIQTETPKRPAAFGTPLIQVTWRAENQSNAGDIGSAQRHYRRTPIGKPTTTNHVHSVRTNSDSSIGMLGTSKSSSGSTGSESRQGLPYRVIKSHRVAELVASVDGVIETDMKGIHRQTCISTNIPATTSINGQHSEMSSSSSSISSGKLFSTPNRTCASSTSHHRPVFNPFESDLIETMSFSSPSPSVFSTVVTPSKEASDMFSWGVDHIAILYPTEIDVNPNQENSSKPMDPEMEERLQSAIDSFFAQKSFAPSPWLDVNQPRQTAQTRSKSPKSPSTPVPSCVDSVKQPNVEHFIPEKSIKNVWSQTTLTLPVDFDFEGVLGKYYTFNCDQYHERAIESQMKDGDDLADASLSESKDGLSASSLRRKLFVNSDEDIPPSTQIVCSPLDSVDDPVFRLNLSPRTPDRANTPTTATSSQFSSSPIVLMRNAFHRTTMTPQFNHTSPTISPIKCFDLKSGDVDNSEINDDDMSFMSTDTPVVHRHHLIADMSVLQEYPNSSVFSSDAPATEATKTSLMDVAFEGDRRGMVTTNDARTSQDDQGYQTMKTKAFDNLMQEDSVCAPIEQGILMNAEWSPIVASTPTAFDHFTVI